jgi:hypothetical protein
MKKIINRYFNFLGVENEGYRRVLSILIIIPTIIIIFYIIDVEGFDDFLEYLFFQDDIGDSFQIYFILLLPTIIVSVIVKVISWVKEGFNK